MNHDNVHILDINGQMVSLQDWQEGYGLPLGSDKIAQYFSLNEARFQRDLQDFGELVICSPLMRLKDAYRIAKGKSVTVTSFNRTPEYQLELKARGFKAATTSPHVFKLASDLDTTSKKETEEGAEMILRLAQAMGIDVRVGYKQYLAAGQTFIHVDVCPMYFAPGRVWNSIPHPAVWEKSITW